MPRRWLRKRRISIRSLLALTSGGLVLIATVTVLWIALKASSANTIELLNDRMVLILDGIEYEVRDKLDSAGSLVDGISREIQTPYFHAVTPNEILDALTVVLATAPDVSVLIYWDRNMVRRGIYRDKDGTLKRLPQGVEADPRTRSRLSSIPLGADHIWGEPSVEGGNTYLNVVTRIASTDADVAFVGAAVSLDQFSRFVASVGKLYDATAFILYGEGKLMAHPQFSEAADNASYGVIPTSESTDPVIVNLDKGVPIVFMQAARARGVEVERVDIEDTRYIVLSRWVPGYGKEPLAIGAYYRQTQLSDSMQRLLTSAIAGFVVVVIAVIAAFVLGGYVSRPIRRLAESASGVARLEIDTTSRPRGSAIAELDQQARAFNLMLDGLKVFETYVPRQLVQRLIALGGETSVASETREITVMFTDIASFTMISDRMGAEETAAFLNRHFGMLADCIRGENGSIDKYIGDAVMAFWGAPDRQDDHAARAVQAARCIAEVIAADNRRRAGKGLKPVRMRIGLHSGPAVVGNIGAPGRVNYTIVGDTVNVAQRIEALGHKLDAGADVTVLMSARTASEAGIGADGEAVGEHTLAGVPYPVPVVRLRARETATRPPAQAASTTAPTTGP
ncbi:adenylate/guanylate cyclase domain-containing protein [Microbaculum sp. FT89]|uniref:adenylate/guanylate cyclase domain-containing protein n=1 Tax=Microbaculum sp. FT89 TaxID=3447298 RepID=UPI003F534AA7